jgi:1,4-dihydroxy-2-naphthoate polyprenyltransferase
VKWLQTLVALLQLGRLHFLAGGVLLHLLGVIVAFDSGAKISITVLLWGQIAITATQLMTHYANDYFDLTADRANQTPTNWSGGSRILVDARLHPQVALIAALVLAAVAFAANLILSVGLRPGIHTFGLLFLAQCLAWFYSAPPLRLHSRGLGEVTATFIVTFLTPLTGYYLQTGKLAWLPVLAVLPLCCFQFAMLLAIEFPDAAGDRQAGKNTLVVRLDAPFAARLYVFSLLLAYAMLPILALAGLPSLVIFAVAALFPLALWQVRRMVRGDWQHPARWNRLAFYTIVLLIGTTAAELVAFLLLVAM